jgi:hypothetical protein
MQGIQSGRGIRTRGRRAVASGGWLVTSVERSGLARCQYMGLCSVLWIADRQEDSLATCHSPLVTALYYRGLERLRQLAREMTKDESKQEGDHKGEKE